MRPYSVQPRTYPSIMLYFYDLSTTCVSQLVRLVNVNPHDDIPDSFVADATSSFLPLQSLGTSGAGLMFAW